MNLLVLVLIVQFAAGPPQQQPQSPSTAPPASSSEKPAAAPAEVGAPPAVQPPAGTNASVAAPKPMVLAEGTEVKLVFAQSVTSRSTKAGQTIEFAVAEDVLVDSVAVIRKGARSVGYVADSASAGGVGKGGALEIRLEAVRANGKLVKLRGTEARNEKRATGQVVGMTILFGLSGFLLAQGHEVKIAEGTPISAYVAESVEFPPTTPKVSPGQ